MPLSSHIYAAGSQLVFVENPCNIQTTLTSEVMIPILMRTPRMINILPTSNNAVARYIAFHGTSKELTFSHGIRKG
jgi:hypothetical protein